MKLIRAIKEIKQGRLPNIGYMFRKIWDYAGKYSEEYGVSRVYLFVDYFVCALLYGCAGDDYFAFNFFLKNHRGKKVFATLLYEDRFEANHTNAEQAAIADDKEKTLYVFSDYINRDWCGSQYNNTEEDYEEFYNRHELGVIKPPCGHGGAGVEIINIREKFSGGEELRNYCISNGFLIEEIIPQHEDISKIYPNSINTIRMITLKGECIGAAMRMGVGNACVDNCHAGGIYSEVDVKSGVIVSNALSDKTSDRYICHPTTGTVIPGIQIPFWNECIKVTKEASKLMNKIGIVGWDVAITPDGPTFVEVNTFPGMGMVQAPNGHGLKAEFQKIK